MIRESEKAARFLAPICWAMLSPACTLSERLKAGAWFEIFPFQTKFLKAFQKEDADCGTIVDVEPLYFVVGHDN